jgi:hypothetical protein
VTSRDREIHGILEERASGGGIGRRAFLTLAAAGVGAGLVGGSLRAHRRGILFPEVQDPAALLPGPDTALDRLGVLAGAVLLAPSALNAQPWTIQDYGDELLLHVDPGRSGGALDAELKELFMGAGAALEAIRVVASAHGRPIALDLMPDPGDLTLACRIRWAEGGTRGEVVEDDSGLLDALPLRRTHRGELGGLTGPEAGSLPIPPLEEGSVRLSWVPQGSEASLRSSVDEGVRGILSDPEQVGALLRWLGAGPGRDDGLGPESLARTRWQATTLRFRPDPDEDELLRLWADGPGGGGPGGALGALFVDDPDSREEQVRAGMAWHRLQLRLTGSGMGSQPLNAPLRRGWFLRSRGGEAAFEELNEILGGARGEPLLIFRAGRTDRFGPMRRNRRALGELVAQAEARA